MRNDFAFAFSSPLRSKLGVHFEVFTLGLISQMSCNRLLVPLQANACNIRNIHLAALHLIVTFPRKSGHRIMRHLPLPAVG